MAKMGRPLKEIDRKEFERLLAIGAGMLEVVAWFDMKLEGGCCKDTIYHFIDREYNQGKTKGDEDWETFSTLKAKKEVIGRTRVRKAVFDMVGRNAAVTIFAAKNLLGWTDKQETTLAGGADTVGKLVFDFGGKKD